MNAQRRGFTFVEMMLVVLLGSMLLMAIYQTLIQQERTYRHFGAVISTQQATRLAVEVLAGELREVSPSGSDVLFATDDSITFRALRKLAVLCGSDKLNKKITVVRMGTEPFQADDSIQVYVDRDTLTGKDDEWDATVVNSVAAGSCALGLLGGLLGGTETELTLPSGSPVRLDSIYEGAPIRSFEHVTYGMKQYAGEWYLARATASDTMVPLIGPIASPSRGGLVFAYYDTLGAALTTFPLSAADRGSLHRIQLEVRGERKTGIGGADSTYLDSLITDIFIRGG